MGHSGRIKEVIYHWRAGLIFSAVLPVFTLINNSQNANFLSIKHIFLTWTVSFVFLLTGWYLNARFSLFKSHVTDGNAYRQNLVLNPILNIFLLACLSLAGVFLLQEFRLLSIPRELTALFILLRGIAGLILILLFQYSLDSMARAQEISLQNEMLKTENVRSQFEILKQQINPHFLFNALSTLRSMVRAGDRGSEEFIIRLSDIYRQLLLLRGKDSVTLSDELDFTGKYIFMLTSRFENMLHVDIDVTPRSLVMYLPTFSLQLLIENCVKHNIISADKPLHIRILNKNEDSVIIENNVQPKVTRQESSGYGLKNLSGRYDLLGIPGGLTVCNNGETFRVTLKLFGNEHNDH
jgi:sensor histidine kinase YesM